MKLALNGRRRIGKARKNIKQQIASVDASVWPLTEHRLPSCDSRHHKMNIKSLPTIDAINFLEHLLKRNASNHSSNGNGNSNDLPSDEQFERNIRDAKEFHQIMETFKLDESDNLIEDNIKDGQYHRV